MKQRLIEHLLGIVFVVAAFLLFLSFTQRGGPPVQTALQHEAATHLDQDGIDFSNPVEVELFRETMGVFRPGAPARIDSLVEAIQELRVERFSNAAYKTGGEERGLSAAKLEKLSGMYVQFILVYLVVMLLSYHGARTLAIYRFVKLKQGTSSYVREAARLLRSKRRRTGPVLVLVLKAVAKGAAYLILFSPAYVIAYSIKTRFDTDTALFMVVLGVISNGLLINYANRFYTLLQDESRKGYVETARVKNLSDTYTWQVPGGVPYRALFRPGINLASHVFLHIYMNARQQFRSTLKQHASFLMTGLIIIEMALNIQGHLGYQMLQEILYKQYEVVVAIILGMFLIVKGTEIAVDLWVQHEAARYENK